MNFQHAANHLAAQGRNGDSMLMHVTPREVSGLQALAQHHGGSLTTNPHTGLPEANFFNDIGLGDLNKFAPAIAGFALDTFVPGAGQTVGGMFGLSGALGTAGIVGGLSALSSGNLSQGIMAGLGAYGGASLAEGLIGAGGAASNSATQAAAQAADAGASGPLSGSAFSNSAALDRTGALSEGVKDAFKNPGDFFGQNKWAMAAAALPALADMGSQGGLPAQKNQGYIRRYAKNPRTGALEQVAAIPVDQFGDQSAVTFGGVGAPVKGMAAGGSTHVVYNEATKKYDTVNADGTPVGPVTFGGVDNRVNMQNPDDHRTDSQKAYDYLMGRPNSKNPMLFYHDNNANGNSRGPMTPIDLNTRTGGHYVLNPSGTGYDWVPDAVPATAATDAGLPALAAGQQGGGGSSSRFSNDRNSDELARNNNPNYSNEGKNYLAPVDVPAANPMSLDPAQQAQEVKNKDELARNNNPDYSNEGRNYLAPASVPAANPMSLDPARQAQENAARQAQENYAREAQENYARESAINGNNVGYTAADHDMDNEGRNRADPDHAEHEGGGVARGGLIPNALYAQGGIAALAAGGLGSLGGYSDGGQLLKGPGDGVSDSIPATIGQGQPARLADNEFVIPARIVSELGNGSTDAGAKQLYAMMARIQAGRKKTIGENNIAVDSKAVKHLPA